MQATKVLVIHTSGLIREGMPIVLSKIEGIEVVACCANGVEAIIKAKELVPDVVLVDARLGEGDAIKMIQTLGAFLPQIRTLLLANSNDPGDLLPIFQAGAKGYVSEKCSIKELIDAINFVAGGGVMISSPLAERLLGASPPGNAEKQIERACNTPNLTNREKQVLCLLIQGASNKEISKSLGISNNTVKAHIQSIMEKLDVHSRLQATIRGRQMVAC